MLQLQTLPASLASLLAVFRPCFTAPSFATFAALVCGLVAQPGRRTVTGMLAGAGLAEAWHHARAHAFFAYARWCPVEVGLALARLAAARLVPAGEPLLVAVDDTLFRRSGRRVHGAGWHRDGAASGPAKKTIAWGNCWVIAGLVVRLPFCDRPVCLPVAAALWRKDGPTKQVLACQLVAAIAGGCPGRAVHVVADAWYAGADGAAGAAKGAARDRGLPAGVSLTARLRVNATLRAIAVPVPGAGGRPRRIGAKLGRPADLAAAADRAGAGPGGWAPAQVRRYGQTAEVAIAERECLWYGVYRCRAVRVILVRDAGKNTNTPAAGYHLALVTTDLDAPAAALVERYAARWSVVM